LPSEDAEEGEKDLKGSGWDAFSTLNRLINKKKKREISVRKTSDSAEGEGGSSDSLTTQKRRTVLTNGQGVLRIVLHVQRQKREETWGAKSSKNFTRTKRGKGGEREP